MRRESRLSALNEILKPIFDLRFSLDLFPVDCPKDASVSYGSSFFTCLVEALVSKSFLESCGMIEEYNGGFLVDDMPCKQVQCCRNVTDRLRIDHAVFKPCVKTILLIHQGVVRWSGTML